MGFAVASIGGPSHWLLSAGGLAAFAEAAVGGARRCRLTPVDVLIAAGAFALTTWGLYRAFFHPVST